MLYETIYGIKQQQFYYYREAGLGISMAKSRERVIFFKRTVSLDHC
jgi:hypothetical protein